MSKLFSPITIKECAIKNRIVMPPMCQYSSTDDGMANDWHLIHYLSRAIGGAGLIIIEATAVEERGRITDCDLGIWSDEHIPMFRRIVNNIHFYGVKVGIQLGHAGRKSMASKTTPVAPSPIVFDEGYKTPKPLSIEEIKALVKRFGEGAKRAVEANFDLIEIHGAHGYLINEFLSPITNKRTDDYGKDKTLFLREVVREVKKYWDEDRALSIRISAIDHATGGVELKDSINTVNSLKDEDVDLWHISSGGLTSNEVTQYPGYQVSYSEEIKKSAGVKTIAVGAITTPEHAEEILSNNRADFVALGRELLRCPYWPLYAAKKLGVNVEWPKQYERAKL